MGAVVVFLVSLAVTIPLGVPIAFVLALCALALMQFMGLNDMTIISQNMVMGTNNASLLAVPFFMLAGEVMARGGLSERIVDFCNIIVGRVKGGLGYVAILASMIFAGLSGSAVADAAALGGILIPLMVKNGYSRDRSTGIVCSGAVIAPIIPPSIPMIVLATTCGLSVSKMFMAGLIPGIILGLCLMICWFFVVRHDGYNDRRTYTKAEALKILKGSLPALFMPVLIVGGIRMGIFTPTEAGAFAVVYALIISVFVYREMKLSDLADVFLEGAKSTGIVMLIVACASAVGWLITVAQIPAKVVTLLSPLIVHPLALLLAINLFLFIMGMIMDLTPNLLIFGPILVPVVKAAGIDPIVFGVIMVLNLTIGLITPPVGTVLYLGCSIGDVSFSRIVKGIMPFLVTEVAALLLFTFFPQLISVPMGWLT
ncbi:MAG: TRAP transporter large permease [Oscillospiraceae bacterium]|nr:TRAP transporter large permease [Oscillospiraceae bacterium]